MRDARQNWSMKRLSGVAVVVAVAACGGAAHAGKADQRQCPAPWSGPPAARDVRSNTGPSWSRDGRRLAFASNRTPSGLYVMDVERCALRHVPHTMNSSHPAWSPVRDVLAFTRDGRSPGIWLVKPDGSGLRRLTRRSDDWPAWAPGGERLAFVRAGSDFGTRNVWVVDADGTHLKRVTRGRWWLTPAWSLDGRWLAVSRTRPTKIDEVGEIWLIRPDGSRRIKLTTSPESIIDEDPAWSPDGRRIVFTRGSLHLVPAHGGRPEKLTSGRDYEPAWSIDGRRIAFVRDHLGPQDLWLLRPDGSQLKRLTRSEPGRRR